MNIQTAITITFMLSFTAGIFFVLTFDCFRESTDIISKVRK